MRSERFETPGDVLVHLSLGSADADISTWEHAATAVEVETRRDDDATRALLDDLTIEHEPRVGGHAIVVRERRQRGFALRLRDPGIRIRVRCPQGSALTVAGGSSDVRGDGKLGAVDVKTGSGDVTLHGSVASARITAASGDVALDVAAGRVVIETASGDVSVGRATGGLLVSTVSGDAEVVDARAGATMRSVSGDISIGSVGGGDIRVDTVSGDASIAIAPGVGVWLDVSSVSGTVASELVVEDAPAGPEGTAVVELRAKSVSGDVHVCRAVAARA